MGQQGAVWARIAKDRERWKTLAEGYFLQWKDATYNRIEQNGSLLHHPRLLLVFENVTVAIVLLTSLYGTFWWHRQEHSY